MPELTLHLFGSPRILLNGAQVEVDTRKATALLAYLAVTGQPHQRDSLAGLMWSDYDQTSARAALRRTLSTLNKALAGAYLESNRDSIGLAHGAEYWLDVHVFREHTSAAAAHAHPTGTVCEGCINHWKAAADLYHEPFMAGFNLRDSPGFEEWQFFQEETLRRELSKVLERLAHALSAQSKPEDALFYARRWLSLDTLNESAHHLLMLLYAQMDQRNAALRQYRECVRILDQELGVAPLEETTRLYQLILNHEPLDALLPRLEVLYSGDTALTSKQTPIPPASTNETEFLTDPAPARQSAALSRPLVGRENEWQRLLDRFDQLERGVFASLEGEAGIGKTRLAEEFLAYARSKGARIIQARCYSGEGGLAYAPFINGLAGALKAPAAQTETAERLGAIAPATLIEAGRLLPEISALAPGLPSHPPGDEGAQARFFEALRQVLENLLAGRTPGVLFLDDLHWADSASISLLTYLARRLRDNRLMILATWRNEMGETVENLERLAAELDRSGLALRLRLNRLPQQAVIDLVRAHPGMQREEPEALGRRLFEESEGLPFVAMAYLEMLGPQFAGPARQDTGKAWAMPTGVRDLLRSRINGLDSTAAQLLSTAAVIGRSFDYQTLREASGRSELEAIDGLDQLLAAGLIVEQDTSGTEIRYDFTHEKLRALIYEETSMARRRLLHRRIAEVLARPLSDRLENAGAVAYHYQLAGQDAQAADYHLLAGEHARRLFANVEALAHFQAALAAGHPDQAGLHEAIGDLHTLHGEYGAALASYEAAAALCKPACLSNLEHKLGNVHHRLGAWKLAESHYIASLEAGEDSLDPAFQVHLYADRSLTAHALGELARADTMAQQALKIAERCQDMNALAQAYNVLGVLDRARSDLDAAIQHLEASLSAAGALDDPSARVAALNNLALVYGESGKLDQAILYARQALDLCTRLGDRHRQAALHNNLADLLHKSGRGEEAMAQLKQAVIIFTEIGEETGSATNLADVPQSEIWKLTEW